LSKKVLLLCLHRPDRSPSQRYRIEQYIPFLEEHGYRFTYSYLLNEQDDKAYYSAGNYMAKLWIVLKSIEKRVIEIKKATQYDLVFVQREAFMLGTDYFEKKIGSKTPMIFDFDDSIWLQKVSEKNKRLAFLKDADKTAKIISHAALVLAGNDYLAEYAKHYNNNVQVVPTTIDMDKYVPPERIKNNTICIGWSGSFSTIQYFEYAVPVLKRIKEKYGDKVSFKIIGDGNYYCKELQTQGVPWLASTEVKDLSELDIGIMPLPDDEWTKGKCGAKGLQYMGLGIATLMSPVGVNKDIIRQGINGYLLATEDEWFNCLSQLIENEELRKTVGQNGLQTVREKYSSDMWKEKYLELFSTVTI
jgi:glycosyltransferase involved in cell wall biosynthesis